MLKGLGLAPYQVGQCPREHFSSWESAMIELRSSCSIISGLPLYTVNIPHLKILVCLGMSAGGEARRKGLGRKKGRGCSNDVIPNDGGM